jgi:ABC-type branched-subunit amino acid transport system ATPase component
MTGDATGLVVEDVVVRYGGHVAVNGMSLSAPRGRITGLIGPNGAGKTTTFNVCSGLLRPSAGRIRLFGQDVTTRSAQHRARMGLGRTFQRMELFDSLPVRENVALGRECRLAGALPWRHLTGSRGEDRMLVRRSEQAMERCGIGQLAGRRPAELSTGQRRLVELARCIAGGYNLMLLDEPSSGLDKTETQRFGAILRSLVAEDGVGILLVEHDMALVVNVCDYLHVLDFGEPIFAGTPSETLASPVVRAAYLGNEAVESAVAGRGARDA